MCTKISLSQGDSQLLPGNLRLLPSLLIGGQEKRHRILFHAGPVPCMCVGGGNGADERWREGLFTVSVIRLSCSGLCFLSVSPFLVLSEPVQTSDQHLVAQDGTKGQVKKNGIDGRYGSPDLGTELAYQTIAQDIRECCHGYVPPYQQDDAERADAHLQGAAAIQEYCKKLQHSRYAHNHWQSPWMVVCA